MTQEFSELEVGEVIRETADSCSIVLRIPESSGDRLRARITSKRTACGGCPGSTIRSSCDPGDTRNARSE